MITRIEAKNYRSLKYVSQAVKPFQILIGANASGKSTFLDVVSFASDIVRFGVREACSKRSNNFTDLTFNRQGGPIELALEFLIPPDSKASKIYFNTATKEFESFSNEISLRYELKILQLQNGLLGIVGERLLNIDREKEKKAYSTIGFPAELVYERITKQVYKSLITRSDNSMVTLRSDSRRNASPGFYLDQDKTGLASVPEHLETYPMQLWTRKFLSREIKNIALDSEALKLASNPGQGVDYASDGSNLPWVAENLKATNLALFNDWLTHIKSALPNVEDIVVHPIPDRNQRYLSIKYKNEIEIPSWLLSDGTLRFLALTLIAYQPEPEGIYLIEEPENGIHPKILEAVYLSLTSVYDAQIMLATHSPLFLTIAGKEDLLIFSKDEGGASLITDGTHHHYLKDWKNKIDLGTLFASGILG